MNERFVFSKQENRYGIKQINSPTTLEECGVIEDLCVVYSRIEAVKLCDKLNQKTNEIIKLYEWLSLGRLKSSARLKRIDELKKENKELKSNMEKC